MNRGGRLLRLLKDPPPEYVFDVSPEGIAMAQTSGGSRIAFRALERGDLRAAPNHGSVVDAEQVSSAIRVLAPVNRNRTAALLLPDVCCYLSVLSFNELPQKANDQLALMRFRLKRFLPFDLGTDAKVAWFDQGKAAGSDHQVVVCALAGHVLRQYEAVFQKSNFTPGFVSVAALACLDLMPKEGTAVMARRSAGMLSLLVLKDGQVRIARSLRDETGEHGFRSELADLLHSTFAYVEDTLESSVQALYVSGFSGFEEDALTQFQSDSGVRMERMGTSNPAIEGYLKGLAA